MFTFLDTLRKPEYTGENRCVPCTITNVAIAGVLTLGVSAVATPLVGAAFLGVSLGAIYLRGYLVPGTPELTKRYFPDWLLALFDKDPRARRPTVPVDADADGLTAETLLLELGVIVEDETGADVVLEPDFAAAWHDRMDAMSDDRTDRDELAALLDVDADSLELTRHGDAVTARMDGVWIGQWESRAAFVADLAADRELTARYDGWTDLGMQFRSEVLGGLRLMLDRCPSCGGAVDLRQDVVESCCRTYDVLAVECLDCGARLLEMDWNPEAFGEADAEATAGDDSTADGDATADVVTVERERSAPAGASDDAR
jgi:hypothetical protein